MDRQTIVAMLMCAGIFLGWQKFYVEPRMPKPGTPTAALTQAAGGTAAESSAPLAATATNTAPTSAAATLSAATPATKRPPQSLALETPTGPMLLSDSGSLFSSWKVNGYPNTATLHELAQGDANVEFAFDHPSLAYLSDVQGTFEKSPTGARWVYEDANVRLERTFILPALVTGAPSAAKTTKTIDANFSATFKTVRPSYAFVSIRQASPEKDPEAQARSLVYWTNDKINRIQPKDIKEVKDLAGGVEFIGAVNRYFALTLIPTATTTTLPQGLLQPYGEHTGRVSLRYAVTAPTLSIPMSVYFGPKVLDQLRAINPKLDQLVDFGWFTIIAYPLLRGLKLFYSWFGNYGLAIILLTVLLKLALYPLTLKSAKSMKEMAKIQPQIQRLRDKYADDKETLNREMMQLMKAGGYNPMAGCLPILLQMPIFIALYQVLYNSIELYGAPFAFWIHDLSLQDPLFITPVLLTVTMFLQQKLTPQAATLDPVQARMMQFMPLMFGGFTLFLPSGLTLYMLINAITSIFQQMIVNKKLDAAYGSPSPAGAR